MFCGDEMFYSEAIRLFQEAGHTIASFPIYANHTYKQVVYFDSEKNILIDTSMLSVLEKAFYISHLFDLQDDYFEAATGSPISYYSINLRCEKKNRSQTARDVHLFLHSTFSSEISIVLFSHDNAVLISVAGFNKDIILSDWYSNYVEYDNLVELIHIAQLSLKSSYEFITDLIYLIAREYYKHPIFEKSEIYGLIPPYYFYSEFCLDDTDDRESIKDLVRKLATEDQQRYGDDYVEPVTDIIRDFDNIDAELDMLSFELDMEEEMPVDIIKENDAEFEDKEYDVYEYEDVDPEIFNDPSLMLKWLDKEN